MFAHTDTVCSVTGPIGTPAGWYPDPAGPAGQTRYWDGAAWGQTQAPKRRRKLWLGLAALAGLLVAVYLVASPYITVHQMKSAAEKRDGAALSKFIEFPSVRESLKDQVNTQLMSDPDMQDNPFAGIAVTLVDQMVDAFVSPAGITRLMAGANLSAEDMDSGSYGKDPFADASMGYQSFDKFAVKVKDDAGDESAFILQRRGIGWKLTDVRMPPA